MCGGSLSPPCNCKYHCQAKSQNWHTHDLHQRHSMETGNGLPCPTRRRARSRRTRGRLPWRRYRDDGMSELRSSMETGITAINVLQRSAKSPAASACRLYPHSPHVRSRPSHARCDRRKTRTPWFLKSPASIQVTASAAPWHHAQSPRPSNYRLKRFSQVCSATILVTLWLPYIVLVSYRKYNSAERIFAGWGPRYRPGPAPPEN